MEVNYEGMIVEGKIGGSEESIGDSLLSLFLFPLSRALALSSSHRIILLHLLRLPRLPSYRHTQRDRSFLQL